MPVACLNEISLFPPVLSLPITKKHARQLGLAELLDSVYSLQKWVLFKESKYTIQQNQYPIRLERVLTIKGQ